MIGLGLSLTLNLTITPTGKDGEYVIELSGLKVKTPVRYVALDYVKPDYSIKTET